MKVNKYCSCCNTVSTFRINSSTNKTNVYCLECDSRYTASEKRKRVLQNVMDLMLASKEINEKCTRL